MSRCSESGSYKKCVTCDNWGGQRQKDRDIETRVVYDDGAKGSCYAKVYDWDTEANSNQCCDKWEKWKALPKG